VLLVGVLQTSGKNRLNIKGWLGMLRDVMATSLLLVSTQQCVNGAALYIACCCLRL
jgi:hypothetical protein